jgi:hypothetical protein
MSTVVDLSTSVVKRSERILFSQRAPRAFVKFVMYLWRMRPQVTSVLVCIAFAAMVLASKRKEPEHKPSPSLAALGQLAQNDKSLPPTATKPSADGTVETYADVTGLRNIVRSSAKDRPGAWKISVDALPNETFTPWTFAPGWSPGAELTPAPPGAVGLPADWFELTDGPMKGAVVHLPGYIHGMQCHSAHLYSASYVGSKAYTAQEGNDPEVLQWACDTGRSGVKAPLMTEAFKDRCREAVKAKGGAITLTNSGSVMTAGDCTHAWMGSNFKCTQERDRVSASVF